MRGWRRPARRTISAPTDAERRAYEQRIAKLERELQRARDRLDPLGRSPKHEQGPALVPLNYEGAEIKLDASTKLARKRRTAATKEPFTVEWIESLPAGEVLYDIGANVGAYSLIAARRPQGPLRVVAFEPGYATFAALCTNVVGNDTADRITPLPVTLGESTRLATFSYTNLSAGAASHGLGVPAQAPVAYEQPVLMYALDDLVSRFQLPVPQHLKIDVDGAELAVMRGAAGLLARVGSLMVELYDAQARDAIDLLARHGLHERERWRGTEHEAQRFAYVLFTR